MRMDSVNVLVEVLSVIALLFIIFAMAGIILLARRLILLSDNLNSLVNTLKEKIPTAMGNIASTAEEGKMFLSDLRKVSGAVRELLLLFARSGKVLKYASALLLGLKMAGQAIFSSKSKKQEEVDKNAGEGL